LVDPPSPPRLAASSAITITDTSSATSTSTILSQSVHFGIVSSGVISTALGNDSLSPTVGRWSGASSQGDIWSVALPPDVIPLHPLLSSSAAGLWADQVLDAAFGDFGDNLVAFRA